MISADIGVSTPLELMLFDGATDKFVRVRIRTTTGVLVDTIDLAHIGEGLYTAIWTPGAGGYYHANSTVYSEVTCTTEDLIYSRPVNSIVDLPKGISVAKKKNSLFFYRRATPR